MWVQAHTHTAQAAAALLPNCCHGHIVLLLLHGCLLLSLPPRYFMRVCLRLRLLSVLLLMLLLLLLLLLPQDGT